MRSYNKNGSTIPVVLILNKTFAKANTFKLNLQISFEELCLQVAKELNLHNVRTLRFFSSNGIELFEEDLHYLKQNSELYISQGENFNESQLFQEYDIIEKIGSGGFGNVMLGLHRRTQQKVAIKFLKNDITNIDAINMIFSEANTLKALKHENIVSIIEFYTFKDMTSAFVMEYLAGGELIDYLVERDYYIKEEEAQMFFRQIVAAIYYCHHRHQIIHRDLKLENILLESKQSQKIKIVDFGIAGLCMNANTDPTDKGSIRYMAPEVLTSQLPANPSMDIWALGIILYILLFGDYPFDGESRKEIGDKIKIGQWQIPRGERGRSVTKSAIDLVSELLKWNWQERTHIFEVSNHRWIVKSIDELKEMEKEENCVKEEIKVAEDTKLQETKQEVNLKDNQQNQLQMPKNWLKKQPTIVGLSIKDKKNDIIKKKPLGFSMTPKMKKSNILNKAQKKNESKIASDGKLKLQSKFTKELFSKK